MASHLNPPPQGRPDEYVERLVVFMAASLFFCLFGVIPNGSENFVRVWNDRL